jgi:hypothetical protein
MKKIIAILVMVCTYSAASANFNAKTNVFVQPFDQSYALSLSDRYWWYTDIELTDFTGSVRDIWDEMDRLRRTFPGFSFSHVHYGGLTDFEYGYCPPLYYATIYSNLPK